MLQTPPEIFVSPRRRNKSSGDRPQTLTSLVADTGTGLFELKSGEERDPNSIRRFYADAHRNDNETKEIVATFTADTQQDYFAAQMATNLTLNGDQSDDGREKRRRSPKISHFPLLPDSLVLSENIDHRKVGLQNYNLHHFIVKIMCCSRINLKFLFYIYSCVEDTYFNRKSQKKLYFMPKTRNSRYFFNIRNAN